MSYREALELLHEIEVQRKPGAAVIRCIANGDYIVIVQKAQFYCWTRQDWLDYLQDEKKKATSGKKRSRNVPDYQEMLVFRA